jgi:hypothetical protein
MDTKVQKKVFYNKMQIVLMAKEIERHYPVFYRRVRHELRIYTRTAKLSP